MVVCRRSYRGKSRKGGPQTPLRCAQNAAFCKPFASAAGSHPYRRRKAGAPVGGASASDGANALSAKDGVSVYGQARPQKCEKNGFRKRTSRARRGRNASVKGLRRPPQAGTAPFLRQAARKAPQPALSFLREKSARAVLSFSGHLMRNQKRRRTDGAAAPQDGKAPAKTRRAEAAACRGPLRRDAHAGRRKSPHREDFPRAAAPIGRAAGPRVGQEKRTFSAPCGLSKKTHSPNPCAGAVLPAFCERRIAKETKPAPAVSEAGSAPNRARGEVPRRRASRRAENPRRYLRLAGGPLVLQQLQRTFFVLVFLYFDYACTQSPAHCAAEKTGRTIFS